MQFRAMVKSACRASMGQVTTLRLAQRCRAEGQYEGLDMDAPDRSSLMTGAEFGYSVDGAAPVRSTRWNTKPGFAAAPPPHKSKKAPRPTHRVRAKVLADSAISTVWNTQALRRHRDPGDDHRPVGGRQRGSR